MLRILIIDDEEDARFLLRKTLVENFDGKIKICGEADSCNVGVELINDTTFDLLFLDIKMPDGSGFDVLNRVKQRDFSVVFVTAFDRFAIKAFEFSTVGYLVKPFKTSDLLATVNKFLSSQMPYNISQNPFKILLENYENKQIRKIVLPNTDGFVVAKLDEILYINSVRNYSEFNLVGGQRVLTSKPLISYENLLNDQGFFRIHHSYLINLSHLKAFVRSEGGAVKMLNGDLLPVSRQKKSELMEKFL